jgi:hypothetical protein
LQNLTDFINKNVQLTAKLQKLQNFAKMRIKMTKKSGDLLILQISANLHPEKFPNVGTQTSNPKEAYKKSES